MAQNSIKFIKKVKFQKNKTEYYNISWDDVQKIKASQRILNAQIDSGDSIVDSEMPINILGSEVNWGAGVINDLIVDISTTSNRLLITQDLGDSENVEVEYADRFSFIVDVTPESGQTEVLFTIPTDSNYVANFIIDWGDGTSSDITSWDSPGLTHTYTNETTCTIEIKGVCEYLSFDETEGSKIISLNELKKARNLKKVNFLNSKIQSIPTSWGKWENIEDFSEIFKNCSLLISIPEDLFKYNTEVTDFSSSFEGCNSLLTIPGNLFKYNTKVTDFSGTFKNCSSLTSVPEDLFKYNTEVTDFSETFSGCSSIETLKQRDGLASQINREYLFGTELFSAGENNQIEVKLFLFDYNTKVVSFFETFKDCSSLSSFPSELFLYNTEIDNISNCFKGSSNITSSVTGTGDFINKVESNNSNINKTGCFDGCVSIIDFTSIPVGTTNWRTI